MELHFKCTCQPGYTGEQCATEIDNCASNPCQNFGTCQNFVNGYHCHCLPGFTGYNCETDINECSSNPCVNGRCEDMVNAFVCHCNRGYTGQKCEKEVDECASSPCQHGGVCVNLVGEYGCGCKAGFRGVNCETDIDECTSNPCQNNGTCVDKINGYNCSCPPGFSGIHCQVELGRRCYTCENEGHAGNCTDRTICKEEELCSMMETLGGKRSSHSIQLCYECCDKNDCNRLACANSQFAEECFEHHCLHNGTCIARNGRPSCKCPNGFRGEHCEIDTPLICYGCAYTASHASCNFLRSCPWGTACYDADKATHEGKLYTSRGTNFELVNCCTDNKCNSHLV
ncbi:hypothetical protein CHS0354_012836 [Potamilus streckersoni]|uniref:EGF-like domain-containing protein n=1 Tax=Potamilus streckersoni TaxID=2493646 RepID=A0AAE0SX67_9BIVA|nr:hypothetical protein CHS0354_012836 [Potamilus streckersoni]